MDRQEVRLRRVGVYERVSSDDQKRRETIKTQQETIDRALQADPSVRLTGRYVDDGVSGTIPMHNRPEGRRLMTDAAKGLFNEVWVYKIDRLGRDDVDPLVIWGELERLGIIVRSVTEGISDTFMYHIHVAVAAQERRNFLMRSADGTNRAAREGRYTGGIVPRGYRVQGKQQTAHLVPSDDDLVWGAWTEAGLVRQIYSWLAVDGWSTRRIASHLNTLGVPTAYVRDGRGLRKQRTQGLWRAGHVRNLVVNPIYRGELSYGRRTAKKNREVISAAVEPLVTEAVWLAAQQTLANNRIQSKRPAVPHLLGGLIVCGNCGLHYCSCRGRDDVRWYRCNGQIVERGPLQGRCPGKSVKQQWLEPLVWADAEAWLRNPGDILHELAGQPVDDGCALAEAERLTLLELVAGLGKERQRAVALHIRGTIDEDELDAQLQQIEHKRRTAEDRLDVMRANLEDDGGPKITPDLLEELRRRLDEGLSFEQRQEIVRVLVKRIVVSTTIGEDGKKSAKATIEYRFPGVELVGTSRGSSHRWKRGLGILCSPPQRVSPRRVQSDSSCRKQQLRIVVVNRCRVSDGARERPRRPRIRDPTRLV